MDHPRISIDPGVMFGSPCIKGRRISVALILRELAAGLPMSELLGQFDLSAEDVQAALVYAADRVGGTPSPLLAAE